MKPNIQKYIDILYNNLSYEEMDELESEISKIQTVEWVKRRKEKEESGTIEDEHNFDLEMLSDSLEERENDE